MTARAASRTGPARRARTVSAVAFGGAAALVGAAFGAAAAASGAHGVPWWGGAVYALGYAVPGAVAGALTGSRLARARTASGAVAVGLMTTVVAAVLLTALVTVAVAVWEASTGENAGGVGSPEEVGVLVGYSALAGLALSPLGMVAGWLGWHRLRRRRRRAGYGAS